MPDNMKAQILNLDEILCHQNGSNAKRGVWPTVVFMDGGFPAHGIVPSKYHVNQQRFYQKKLS